MHKILYSLLVSLILLMAASCSTISTLEDDDMLYIGMRHTKYTDYKPDSHFSDTKDEVEAAIACPPNGAFFGSPYYRTPVPYRLWIWNAWNSSDSPTAKWVRKTLGKAPVLVADVNPELRSTVAETVLRNNGYFRGKVGYELTTSRVTATRKDSIPRPRKGKIAYTVDMGPLFTLDSISYGGFTDEELRIIRQEPSLLRRGDAFSLAALEEERTRIFKALREYGYYFYQKDYCSYLADTTQVAGKVQLQIHKTDSLPPEVSRKWVIGKTQYRLRREFGEQLTDTLTRRFLTLNYGGSRPPLRPRVMLPDVRLRPGNLFSQSAYEESADRLVGKGIFSGVEISFTPQYNVDGSIRTIADTLSHTTRDGKDRSGAGVLNMLVDCTLEKPYDVSVEANFTQKTSGRGGPGAGLSFAKRNAFRGGEILSFNLSGTVDFPIGKKAPDRATNYDVIGDITLEMPRMLLPNFIKPNRRWYTMPTTMLRGSYESLSRSGFYRRNIFSAEMTYSFRPKETIRHTFTPLKVDYSYVASHTARFDTLAEKSAYMLLMLEDNFVPKMRYTFDYTSPSNHRNPISLSLSFTEAGNITNLALAAAGKGSWNTEGKTLFGVPVSQFVKTEVDWRKTWMTGKHSRFVAHAYAGHVHSYGNLSYAPSAELFYMGGANDLRGFSTRSVGPGGWHFDDRNMQYVLALGDLKLLGNIEYRPLLFGSLYGALFLDFGNCWYQHSMIEYEEGKTIDAAFSFDNLPRDIAVDAGVGIRYDLGFFVLRVDWGFIVHAPYTTDRRGYFNTPSRFSDMQCLNFAIGYPF